MKRNTTEALAEEAVRELRVMPERIHSFPAVPSLSTFDLQIRVYVWGSFFSGMYCCCSSRARLCNAVECSVCLPRVQHRGLGIENADACLWAALTRAAIRMQIPADLLLFLFCRRVPTAAPRMTEQKGVRCRLGCIIFPLRKRW